MKKLLLIISFVFIVTGANADEWELRTSVYKTVALDQESIVQSGSGLQLSLHRKNIYLYMSKDVNQVRFVGQGGPDVNLWSAGIGMQHSIGKHLNLSVDVGWYEPRFKEMGEPQDYMSSTMAEGLGRYLNSRVTHIGGQGYYDQWEYYKLNYHGSIGGKINVSFEQPITENIVFSLSAGYRYLKLLEHISGEDYDGGLSRLGELGSWQIRKDRDFSSFIVGGTLSYKF